MIRQAINCDICAAEKQESNYWFVAYEQGGELKLRGWESPQNSRKNAKHLCGQKCAQRMMANFMATLAASSHVGEPLKEIAPDNVDRAVKSDDADIIGRSERLERPEPLSTARDVAPWDIHGAWIAPRPSMRRSH